MLIGRIAYSTAISCQLSQRNSFRVDGIQLRQFGFLTVFPKWGEVLGRREMRNLLFGKK
jgi:hypothetical protein